MGRKWGLDLNLIQDALVCCFVFYQQTILVISSLMIFTSKLAGTCCAFYPRLFISRLLSIYMVFSPISLYGIHQLLCRIIILSFQFQFSLFFYLQKTKVKNNSVPGAQPASSYHLNNLYSIKSKRLKQFSWHASVLNDSFHKLCKGCA